MSHELPPIPDPPSGRTPPPIPPLPLPYAGPPAPGQLRGRPTLYHQAATASWAAPLIAFVLNLVTNSVTRGSGRAADAWGELVIGGINLLLILGGFVLALVALGGIRRYGSVGILKPAVAGLAVNTLILVAGVGALLLVRRIGTARPAPSAVATHVPVTTQQAVDSVQRFPGWIGTQQRYGTRYVVVGFDPDSPVGREVKDAFTADYLFMDIAVTAPPGTAPVTVNAATLSLHLTDGTVQNAVPPAEVFRNGSANFSNLRSAYRSTATVPEPDRAESDLAAFFPGNLDPTRIDYATLLVGDTPLVIPGKYLTAAQKAANLAATTRPAARRPTTTHGGAARR